jgi:AbiEi antitoxin C-terminal domain
MMQALGRRYYVSLASAAELHGAVEPAESEPFQVMVDRHVTDRELGRLLKRQERRGSWAERRRAATTGQV